ncbi:ATP-binding cassette domain-containing protein [uncultured Ruminococcus sp.]|uniref:ATP-binding cassette domain-containing protein n=1 Tax=uncultured Ruminococcus sp. TaxID=165186 RepID=UPI00292E9BF9|nr:FHA domain-containing protein [uncultured Ruminococcus sp.]
MSEEKTAYYRPVAIRPATLLIIDKRNVPYIVSLDWDMTLGREYPGADTNIRVQSLITGRRHGEFVHDDSDDSFYYIDNNSTNGTYINGVKLPPYNARGSKAYKLWDGDIIRIDRKTLSNPHPESVLIIFSRSFDPEEQWQSFRIPGMTRVTIGRGENNMIRLQDIMASREHAYMIKDERGMFLYDCNSQNGISVNGRQVEGGIQIFNRDVIRIANTLLIVIGDQIYYNHPGEKVGALSVHVRSATVNFGRKTLLNDVRFNADTGDFILILGGSGAGKTTLINAILGNNSPGVKTNGEVILDGLDLYKNFKTMKSQIGLVPQFIDLRLNDKVRQTLMDIAEIKLSSKFYSKEDKQKRVDEILNRLGVKNLENHLIRQLSGGQKKKVSVAAQLVGFQKVFICDEPDSGLDAASRVQQMEILKEIANNGKIVMVISHEPDDAVNSITNEILFTKVLVLAKSSTDNAGHLAFFGSPYDALEYFGVNRLQDIMKEINPDYEGGKGRADYYINKFLTQKGGGFYQ